MNNTSTISYKVEAAGGSAGWYMCGPCKVVVAGKTVYNNTGRWKQYKGTLHSGTITVRHNNNGTASFSASISSAIYYYADGTGNGSKTWSLNTIPRASQPSVNTWPDTVSSVNIGDSITIHMNKKASFTHKVTATFGNKTEVVTNSCVDNVVWNGFTLAKFAGQIPNATSGTLTFTVDTMNGSKKIGTKTVSVTANLPSTVVPSCSISSLTNTNNSFGCYAKLLSGVKVKPTAAGVYGSTIRTLKISVTDMNDKTASSGTEYTFDPFQKIGSIVVDDNFGIFLFTFTQYTLSCFIFANIIDFQNKLGTSDVIKLLTFLFFSLSPSWYLYAYTFMKDTSYYLMFIIFFINYIKFFYNESDKKSIITLLISSLFLILIRNNGIYVVSVSLLALCFLKPDYKKTSISFVILFFIVQLILNTVIKINGIEPSNIRETLSIPVQQIARYTIYNNLTEEEKEKISKVFMYDENDFALNYNPDISDPIKESLVIETKSDLKEFLSLWWSLLKKDPVTYIDATLNNTYGYFYPYKEDVKESIGYFRVVSNKKINKGNFDFYMNRKYKSFRKGFEENFYHLRRSKYIKFIYNTGTYFIVLVIILGYSLYIKRYDYLVISIPLLLTYAFCILSPVNAYLRYMNPIIVCLPIMISLVTSTKYNKN